MTPRTTLVLIPLLVVLLASPATGTGRVVAVGDVHGAYEPLLEILQAAGIVDAEARWAAGDATLVQVGDFLDRGAGVLEVMDLLMRLQEEAPRSGGRVIVLLGNHEVMNLLGIFRDVSPELFTRLAGPGQDPPAGRLEYAALLGPEGRYGRWLRTLPAVVRIDDALYLHAGLSAEMEIFDPEEVTARVHDDLRAFDDYRALLAKAGLITPATGYEELWEIAERLAAHDKGALRKPSREIQRRREDWTLTDLHGPLWFRGFTNWKRLEGARNVATLKRELGVEHFVVGHTPVRDREIHHRFDGTIFLTDTGMLSEHYRGGRPSVLERDGDTWTAVYLDDRDVLLGPGTRQAIARGFRGPDGEALPFASDDEALEFLSTARVVSHEELTGGTSRTLKVLLERDGVRAHAAFRTVDLKLQRVTLGDEVIFDFHDSYRFELAAYELSRLLGLDLVPPTVPREIDGERGSLQLWVEGATTEAERTAAAREPPEWDRWYRQLQLMRVFDRLIFNFDRNRGNILIDDDWKLWLIDHTRSFRSSPEVPAITTVTHVEENLWRRLRELRREEVEERLTPWVGGRQVRTLMKRRDRIVDAVESLIARFGAEAVIFDLDRAPAADETVRVAEDEIESFLDDLPDESVVPPELAGSSR